MSIKYLEIHLYVKVHKISIIIFFILFVLCWEPKPKLIVKRLLQEAAK